MDFDVIGQLTVNDDGTSTLQTANGQLDDMSEKSDTLQSALMGVASGFTFAFVTTALSAIKGAGDALIGFIGDSLAAADKHDKAIAQINAALKSNTAAANTSAQSGGQWVKTQDLSTKAAAALQKKIDTLNQSIADTNQKDAIMGKTSASTAASLTIKGQKLAALNTQLADGTKAHQVWVNNVAQDKPVVQMTLEGIEQLSKSMSRKTLFSQDQYLAASQYLIQMRTIGKDVFPQAMQATADLATRMNVDLSSAAQTVSKALANPTMGIGRLNTQFKLFNSTQQKAIEYMAAHGQLAKAQTMIMDGLTKAVGGSATAAAEAGLGPWQLLSNVFEDVKDTVGEALIPAIDNIARAMGPVLDAVLPKLTDLLSNTVGPALTQVSTAVGYFVQDIMAGKKPMDALNDSLYSSGFTPDQVKSIDDFANGIANFISGIPAAIKSIGDFVSGLAGIPGQIKTTIDGWIAAAATAVLGFEQTGKDIVTNITNGINSLHDTPVAKSIQQQVNDAGVAAAGFVVTGTQIVGNIAAGIGQKAADIGTTISGSVSDAVTLVKLTIQDFTDTGTGIITNIVNGISSTIANVGTEITKGPAGWIADAKKAVTDFTDVGASIVSGIVSGIAANIGSIADKLLGGLSDAWNKAKSFIGMGSPSKLFATMGHSMMSGMAIGITHTADMPVQALGRTTQQMVSAVSGGATNTTNHYYMGAALYQPAGSVTQAAAGAFKRA